MYVFTIPNFYPYQNVPNVPKSLLYCVEGWKLFEFSDEVALNKLNEELLDGRHSPESLMHLFDILQIENAR